MMASDPTGRDAAQEVADGLLRNGYPVVSNTEGYWATTTAICHGGDNVDGLWFRNDGKGGLIAKCWSGKPACETRTAAPGLRAAAGISEQRRAAPKIEWYEQCVYRHPEGYTSRRAMRYDWPGGAPCSVERRRGGKAYRCDEVESHKHIQHRAINDGPMPPGDRYAGYLLHVWEPLRTSHDPSVVVITEGEKDAAAIRDDDCVAASYLGGSGKAADADYRDLAGKTVVVWGDDDAKGRRANAWVMRRAWEGGASHIYLVPEPGGETGHGAADVPAGARADVVIAALDGPDLATSEPPVPQPEPKDAQGPGRPQQYHEDEYIVHRRNTRPQHWWEELAERNVPTHLRPDWGGKASYQDCLRVLEYQGDHILRVGREVYMAESSTGLWQLIQNGSSGLDMLPLIRQARRGVVDDVKRVLTDLSYDGGEYEDALRTMMAAFNNGRRHADNVAKDVASHAAAYREEFANVLTTNPVRFDDVQSAGALPLVGGAAAAGYEWATGRILTAAEMRRTLIRSRDWHIDPPDFSLLDNPNETAREVEKMVHERFMPWLERTAVLMLGPNKTLDAVRIPLANSGKSSFVEALSKAFPGAISYTSSSKDLAGEKGDNFNKTSKYLTMSLVYISDECDKPLQPYYDSTLTGLQGDRLEVELKGLDSKPIRRIGNLVLVGNDWPDWNTDAPGMEARIVWAYNRPDVTTPYTKDHHDLLVSEDGVAWIRAAVLQTATDYLRAANGSVSQAQEASCNSAVVRRSVAECLHAGSDPDMHALREVAVYTGQDSDFTLAKSLMDAAGVDASKYQGVKQKRLLRRAFKDAREGRRNTGTGLLGVKMAAEANPEPPPGVGV